MFLNLIAGWLSSEAAVLSTAKRHSGNAARALHPAGDFFQLSGQGRIKV
jgi:hypothetical protein